MESENSYSIKAKLLVSSWRVQKSYMIAQVTQSIANSNNYGISDLLLTVINIQQSKRHNTVNTLNQTIKFALR